MICIARIFGAPVTDPPGNVARRRSGSVVSGRNRPAISATPWCTVGWVSMVRARDTRTEPNSQTRPRSLRTRSMIMFSSAASFAEASSSAAGAEEGRVPLIGRVTTRRETASTSRKSSGLSESRARPSGSSRYAPYHAPLSAIASTQSRRVDPSKGAVSRCVRFA